MRSRRNAMREAFHPLSESVGSPLISAAPLTSLHQAFVTEGSEESPELDPLQLATAEPPRPPVADIAALLRSLNHVAHGALRRMVGGGESVPVERVTTWSSAVRELLLEEYQVALEKGRTERALRRYAFCWGLEIQGRNATH